MNGSLLMIVKGIIVVYLSRRTTGNAKDVEPIIKKVLKDARLPTNLLGSGGDGDIAQGLRDTLEWIIELKDDVKLSEEDLIARIRINTGIDNHYTDIIEQAIAISNEELVHERIRTNISEIKHELSNQDLVSTVRDANRTLNKEGSYVNKEEFIGKLQQKLDDLKSSFNQGGPVSQSKFNSEDEEGTSLADFLMQAKENMAGRGVLKTGLQGLNKMVHFGGLPRGYYINIAGLTGNYKTGLMLDLFRQIPMYNKPYMWDETKKPLVLRISFENRIEQDVPKLYRDIVGQETGEKVEDKDIDPVEAEKLIKERLSRHGYHFAMEFFSPNDFSVDDAIAVLESYERKGYEIHLLDLDYLELIAKNDKTVREDMAITNGIERLRGFCFPKGITVISGHQLSTEAQELARLGASNFVVRVSSGGWYMNCKSLHTKVDTEILIHIVQDNDTFFLTMARGKNRNGEDTPVRYRKCAYRFHSAGAIHDDVEKDRSEAIYDFYKLTSDAVQEAEGKPAAADDGW